MVGLREIGAVAPVLSGAEEEHLDRRLPAFLIAGEDVGLRHIARIDALMALHMRQRSEAVAIGGGLLEIEPFGCAFHGFGEVAADRLALAGEEGLRLGDEFGVVARARSRRCKAPSNA